MTTGYLYHEIYGWHDTGSGSGMLPSDPRAGLQPFMHFETGDTKRRLHELVVVSGLIDRLQRIAPRPATVDELLLVHTERYVESIRAQSELPKGGDMGDGGSPFGAGGFDIGLLSTGGVIATVEAVVEGRVANAYALVRPPGHHALPDTGMGFCMFANLAVAARAVRKTHGVERIAIVDWDVHHGNGTQDIFWDDPQTLAVSLHQDSLYPHGSGTLEERGGPGAEGATLNLPLPPGTGNAGYLAAMERVVVPALRDFRPDLILVASGFDASSVDPLSHQMLMASAYRRMTEMLMEVAADVCGDRLAMAHEGGYSPVYTPFCGLAVIEALAGTEAPFADPFDPIFSGAQQPVQPHQDAVIEAALRPTSAQR